MKKITLFIAVFLICSPHLAFSESVSLSTYYPAPFGAYDRIRLVPRPEILPVAGPCKVGMLYARDSDYTLRYCRDVVGNPEAGEWGTMSAGIWENDGSNNVYLIDTDTIDDFSIGIGDIDPDALLEVSSSGQGFDLLMLSTDDDTDGDLFMVNATGQVGIGTVSPTGILDVASITTC